MNFSRSPKTRSAFTLVELLIAITVIGILVGLLTAYALIPALQRAKEFAIQQEMSRIGQAIENFEDQFNFYPPSWIRIANPGDRNGDGTVNNLDSVAALLPFINRIAPNHQEAVGAPGSRPIDTWYATVGVNIEYEHGDDLVFWLSGLGKNKQFPLTADGNAVDIPNAYDDGLFPRQEFYDFKAGQLVLEGTVAHYNQPQGKDAEFLYIDNDSYGYGPNLAMPLAYDGYTNSGSYENADTFQLVTAGLDGRPGLTGDWRSAGPDGEDNICNFAEGRLDALMLGTKASTVIQ